MSFPGFPVGGASDLYGGAGGFSSQSAMNNQPVTKTTNNDNQNQYQYQHSLYLSQPSNVGNPMPHIAQYQQFAVMGKRTLAEFQTLNHPNNMNITRNHNIPIISNSILRSVKPRTFPHTDFSTPDSSTFPALCYGVPLHHLGPNSLNSLNPQPFTLSSILPNTNFPTVHCSSLTAPQAPEKNIMDRRLQELEKQLLEDNDEEQPDLASVVTTTSEWSHTIQNLITLQKPASSSPSSSTTTLSNTCIQSINFKQSLIEAATVISEGNFEAARDIILTRLSQNLDHRFLNCMVSALKSRINPVKYPPPIVELYGSEQVESIQLLFEHSLFFKIALLVANIAILDYTLHGKTNNAKLCIVDFDIGNGNQYACLLHELFARLNGAPAYVKIITVADSSGTERLNTVGVLLGRHAQKLGIGFEFKVLTGTLTELTRESLGCNDDESLVVNFAFNLYKVPDESVSTENPRDQLLRRVKALAPRVVTILEQEANTNTAPFVARVIETCSYFGPLFDSLETTMSRENSERIKIEEGLSRKVANSLACEGRDRIERYEVFGKWSARMTMAGFKLKPLNQKVAESFRTRLGAGNGVAIKSENGGLSFGWMGRTLAVASAWS